MKRCTRPDKKTILRTACLALALMLCLSLASCAADSRREGRTVKIALLSGQASTEASAAFAGEFEAAMAELSDDDITYDVTVMLAGGSSSKQAAQADMCCLQDYDMIVIEPADPSKGDELLGRCVRYVPLEEAESREDGEEGDDEDGEEDPDIWAAYEKTAENGSYSDERVNAEPRQYPFGVYDPPTVPETVPVVFAGLIPVITPREEPEEDTEDAGPVMPDPVWCVAAFDCQAVALALADDIIEKRLLRDVNGDGKAAYAFVCTDPSNPVNQAVMNTVKASLTEAVPGSEQAFTCFMALSEDAFVERLIYYMTGNLAADLIIALDDDAIDYTDTFSAVCGYEEDEAKRHDVTFDLGDELLLAGIGHSDFIRVMFEEGTLSSLVIPDPWELARAVAERCVALAAGEDPEDVYLESVTARDESEGE
ncbi:MAG: hypothetical protein J5822_08295 [Eubacteriaceae bacterium]|nr:hypothetical protein [Eubacteriaceae bacterium]